MSRSYKKTPIVKDNTRGRKKDKRFANKKVRNTKDIPNGKQFRKVYNPYDIYDYISYQSLSGWLFWREGSYPTKEEAIQAWRKIFYIK